MPTITSPTRKKNTFMDIPTAAGLAGFSHRHARRKLVKEGVRIVEIRGKFFVVAASFDAWQAKRDLAKRNKAKKKPKKKK